MRLQYSCIMQVLPITCMKCLLCHTSHYVNDVIGDVFCNTWMHAANKSHIPIISRPFFFTWRGWPSRLLPLSMLRCIQILADHITGMSQSEPHKRHKYVRNIQWCTYVCRMSITDYSNLQMLQSHILSFRKLFTCSNIFR